MRQSQKILYVEDDPGSQLLVSRLLTAEGYDVILAGSGLEGIRAARTERPSLVLMDINMGDLDGYEVTTRLRSIDFMQSVPIIALTANVLKGDKERALIAGCDGYLSKPIDVDEFPAQIEAFLKGHKEIIPEDKKAGYLTEYNRQLVEHLESKVIALQEANQALQQLEKMKSDFIVLAAHELRTPLTTVYGYARLLLTTEAIKNEDDPGSGQIRYLSQKIFNATNRLNEVVNDILNIAHIQANRMELTLTPTSLEKVVNAALLSLNPLEKGRNLIIDTDRPLSDLPLIKGDEERLQQVFWNLLSNAVKYTPDGGSITIGGFVQGAYVILYIKDGGIGIPKADQPNIFSSFYVTSDTAYHTSSKVDFMGGGMGIGLSIVKGIVDAHRGRVWVESDGINGLGSTFFVKLPISQD